jgi:hypothetical protein
MSSKPPRPNDAPGVLVNDGRCLLPIVERRHSRFSRTLLPPSTTSKCPLTYEAAGEHRNAAAAATSAGTPERPVGVAFPARASDSVCDPVAIQPGAVLA